MRRDIDDDNWNSNATNIIDRFSQSLTTRANEKYLNVNKSEYLQFWFEIPTKDIQGKSIQVDEVEFRSLVGNDYKFSVAEIYKDVNNTQTQKNATYFYTAKEAEGNIKDMSNMKWVSFKYGQMLANMLMGFRIDSNIKDFKFAAEIQQEYALALLYEYRFEEIPGRRRCLLC